MALIRWQLVEIRPDSWTLRHSGHDCKCFGAFPDTQVHHSYRTAGKCCYGDFSSFQEARPKVSEVFRAGGALEQNPSIAKTFSLGGSVRVVKEPVFGMRPGFKSVLCYYPAMWPWTCSLTSEKLCFFIYNMGIGRVPTTSSKAGNLMQTHGNPKYYYPFFTLKLVLNSSWGKDQTL